MKHLIMIFFVLPTLFFGGQSEAAEPKTIQGDVTCNVLTPGGRVSDVKQLKISKDGKFELTENGKTTRNLSFPICSFNLFSAAPGTDKLALYTCKSKDLPSGFKLERNQEGYYNLIETGKFKGKPTLGNSALKGLPPEKRLGTFECVDPTYAAWLSENKRSDPAPSAGSSVRSAKGR